MQSIIIFAILISSSLNMFGQGNPKVGKMPEKEKYENIDTVALVCEINYSAGQYKMRIVNPTKNSSKFIDY